MSKPSLVDERVNGGEALLGTIVARMKPGGVTLDVGSGMGFYTDTVARMSGCMVLVDAFKPYMVRRAYNWAPVPDERTATSPPLVIEVTGRAQDALQLLAPVFDYAIAIDFMEHLDKADALNTISLMKHLAPRVGVFIPDGDHPQWSDGYHMGGDHWQTHRSTWRADDLMELGFDVRRWLDFHAHQPKVGGEPPCEPHALWAYWERT